jgi:branched-subunit amino acid aminotransferase/4-amino-4-deoxychorismate lyase
MTYSEMRSAYRNVAHRKVGTMNLFVVIENEKGQTELITPPLEDLILPGVTRDR